MALSSLTFRLLDLALSTAHYLRPPGWCRLEIALLIGVLVMAA
jgi:hypothetical protein